jgi:hypothetical protein
MMAAPATAARVITAGAGAVQPDENVLTTTNQTAKTVVGTTNQTNTSVSVSSLNNEILTTTASNGQARFESTDGSLDTATIFLTGGQTFTSAEFNLFNAIGTTSSVLISFNGGVAQSFNLANGQNFFGFLATGGDTFSSISFDTNGTGVVDLRQLRVGGIQAAVPEPGTWAMMLLGFGAIGASMRRNRRRSTATLAQMA